MYRSAADAVREEIAALNLDRHVVALETNGYTVLTPEEIGCGDLVQRVNEAIDRVATRRSPEDSDLASTYGGFLFHLVFTRRIAQAGDLIGIRLLDHIIVGHDGSWTSLRERGGW